MIKLLALAVWLSAAPALGADLYQWTDARGGVHFSDNLQTVPQEIRNSGRLSVRKDFFAAAPSAPTKPTAKTSSDQAVRSSSDAETSLPVEATAQPPVQVLYAPQETTIVIVNGQRRPSRHRPPCRGAHCPTPFRPDFSQRQYIHPSAFDGGSRQYVQP